MITRVEIDGFRNFVDFSVDLRPFQVVAGPNAAGKSNFFDALLLISRLAERDSLKAAFEDVRGDPLDQFTTLEPGNSLKRIRLAIEAIVPPRVRDPWGGEASLSSTHLRYEVVLALDEASSRGSIIRVASERLLHLKKSETQARLRFDPSPSFVKQHLAWGSRQAAFISTAGKDRVVLHQDGRAGRKREYRPRELEGTVLSGANSVTFRHAFAMRQELGGIVFLQLEPESLRRPSTIGTFRDPDQEKLGVHGTNLPAVLARLKTMDEQILAHIARDLRGVVSDASFLDVLKDTTQKRWVAQLGFDHGGPFPASLLSDGTLRILALAALKHDGSHRCVLCFEEPENGIHPLKMRALLRILVGLATDASGSSPGVDSDRPLRQLLVNTHSPALVSAVDQDALLFSETYRHYHPDLDGSILVARFLPIYDELPLRAAGARREYVSRTEVLEYLASVDTPRWQNAEVSQ